MNRHSVAIMSLKRFTALLVLFIILFVNSLHAQDLEPRFLSPAPVGMNFGVLSYAYSLGNVVLDQSLPIEGTEATMHAITPAYARSIDVFGLAGRITAVLPMATCTWRANLDGVDTSTVRTGFGDPVIALSVNFIGSPALDLAKFAGYKTSTIVGFSLKVRLPIGQYDKSKFFNLSTGRWQISPRLGISRTIGRFVFEGYATAWFFSTNNDFYGGNTLEQDPMVTLQIHAIYQFRRGFWGAVSFGQSYGGETKFNGVASDNAQTNNRMGATFSYSDHRCACLKSGVYLRGDHPRRR